MTENTMDKQRKKLIELLGLYLPINVRNQMGSYDTIGHRTLSIHERERLADHILADGWIRLPCKVGDEVYYIGKGTVQPMRVSYSVCAQDGMTTSAHCEDYDEYCTIYCDRNITCGISFDYKDIGKTVFLSREAAEKALKGVE